MADIAKALARIRALGANVVLDQSKLVVVNRPRLPATAAEFIRAHAAEIAAYLSDEGDFEERAAIIEHDGGLTRERAEYLSKMLMQSCPDDVEPADWQWFVGKAAMAIDATFERRAA